MTVQSTGISEHPRLFATSESIARLKKTVGAGTPKWLYDRLIEQCQHHVAEVDLKESRWSCAEGEKGGLTGFWENPREILDMSLGCLLTDDGTYRDLALRMIEKMTGWETWFHRYEPDRGMMLQSMAVAYDLMYDALGPDRARRLRKKIASECDDMLAYLRNQGQQHKHSHNTGGARTFSAFGIAAMAIRGECEHAEEWLELARDGVACWIEAGLDEDGGTRYATEGSYNVSAIDHVTAFVIAYRNVFGKDPCDLIRLRKYVLFSLYKLEPQRDGMGQFGVFGRVGTYAPETMIALMALFDDGLARWFFDVYYGPEADLDRFRLDERVANRSESCYVLPLLYWKEVSAEQPDTSPRLERAALFRGSGKAVMRTGFEDIDDLQLMIQCQSPQHGHSQADVGNFTLNALGERFIDDPGCASGSPELRPRAWGSYVWGCSPAAHNLVLIDGVAGGTHSFGTIPDFLHSDMADYLLAEMKPAYDARSAVRRAQRHVVFVRPSYFVIIDDVRKDDQPHGYELLLHAPTHRPLKRIAGENQFLWRRDRADLLVAFAHPRSVSFAVPTAELVAEQAREGDSKDWSLWPGVLEKKNPLGKSRLEKQDHLDFLERMKEEEEVPPFYILGTGEPGIEGLFFTLLYPVRHGNEVPSAAASSTAGVVSMTIDGRDLVAFNRTGGAVEAGEVETDAAVFHTRVEEGRMAHWVAARATMWRHGKTGLATTESITVSFQGVTGRVVAARETPLTITYPGIQGMELDGTPVHGAGLRENEMTIRLPAGEHGLRIVTDRGEAYFRERE